MKRMDESNMSIEESGSSRRSVRNSILRLSRSPSPETEASNRTERMGEAKDVGYQISLNSELERKIEEIGSRGKSKKGRGRGSRRRSMKSRALHDSAANICHPDITFPVEEHPPFCILPKDPDAIVEMFRKYRAANVKLFNDSYVYGPVNSNGQGGSRSSYDCRYLICPNGSHSWLVPSSGITWTAVHGKDSICVVTKNEDVDRGRLKSFLTCLREEDVRARFMTTIVHEMEDPSSELRQRFEHGVKMRSFAAVSVARGTVEVGEESGDEASEAIDFLKKKLENSPAFTYQKTVQTAISALQHLHRETFQATDIMVAILRIRNETKLLNSYDIQKHLEVIRIGENQWV